MSDQQYSPWASGDGFGAPQPRSPHAQTPPGTQWQNPSEPGGWSPPQQFGLTPQPPYPSPATAYTFGQRLPYDVGGELPEHPNATTVLVLGIVGLAAVFVAFPFLSPVAWYLGAKARREMRDAPGRYRRSGALTAGYLLGVLGTLIALAFVGLIVLGIVMLAAF